MGGLGSDCLKRSKRGVGGASASKGERECPKCEYCRVFDPLPHTATGMGVQHDSSVWIGGGCRIERTGWSL